jgi:hypothetical protein
MIRELDQSKITLRLIEHVDREGKGTENHVLAKLSGPTLNTLQRCLYTPVQLPLEDDHGRKTLITVKAKFIPLKMKLDQSESMLNMGRLKIDVIDGANLPAADRNNFSDPYCRFLLNGRDIYKTDTKKKTLNPVYNETFETIVRSRTSAKLECHVYDWDFGDKDDFLGKGVIDLSTLEPFQRRDVQIPLDGKSGTIRVRLLFTPDYVTRMRQGSSTFHGTLGVAGKVAGAPVKTVGKGAAVVGDSVARAGTFLGKGFRRRKSRAGSEADEDGNGSLHTGADTPPMPTRTVDGISGTPASHNRVKSFGAHSIHSSTNLSPSGSAESGAASISVLSARGFPPSANIRIHIKADLGGKGPKDLHKTKAVKSSGGEVSFGESESFRTLCAVDTPFRVLVKDHSTLGRDDELGEGTFFLADQAGTSGAEHVVKMTKGEGSVLVRSRFEPADKASMISSSAPKHSGLGSRMGWGSSKRDSRERSVTPNA